VPLFSATVRRKVAPNPFDTLAKKVLAVSEMVKTL